MNGPKQSMKMLSSSASQVVKSSEEELMEKYAQLSERNSQLSERNIQLAQEVQKLRQSNTLNVKRVVEYSKRALDATSENNRLKESLRRVSALIQRFLPVLLQGSNLMQDVVADLGKISIAENNSAQTNPGPTEAEDDANSGELVPSSPQRTGIARPMVKGYSISKPSISLQRVVPRQTAAPYVPLPIRDLNLADMVRADDQNRPLDEQENEDGDDDSSRESGHGLEETEQGSGENEHGSEESEHSAEGNEHASEENEHSSEENGHDSEENGHDSEENELGSEGNEHGSEKSEHSSEQNNHTSVEEDHDSVENNHHFEENDNISERNEVNPTEIEPNSEDNESLQDPDESNVLGMQYQVPDLSAIEEEQSVLEDGASENSAGSEAMGISANLSPVAKEGASTSEPRARSQSVRQSKSVRKSKPVRQSESIRLSRKKAVRAEAEDETSEDDEEKVELSLIKARCKLMNGDRRKELKEGTSKDYDARGNFSPNPRRNRKRKKTMEEDVPKEEETRNETSALRRSIDGLMSSLKKSRVSRNKRSIGSDSPRRLNGFVGDEMHPRVSLVRMSSLRNLDAVAAEEESHRSLSPPFLPSLSVLLTQTDLASPPATSPPSTTPPLSTSPIMVTKRRRCSYVTTRNKRSSRHPVIEEAVVLLDEVEDQPLRSGVKRSKSWAESMKKRNRAQSDDGPENESKSDSPQQAAEANGCTSISTDELPTVVLSRCSDTFIARKSSKGALDRSLNDAARDSDTPLSVLASRQFLGEKDSPAADVSSGKVAAEPTRSKPRSKPKPKTRSKPSAKSTNANERTRKRIPSECSNGNESDSRHSLNPSLLSLSVASSVGDAENGSPSRTSTSSRPRRAKAPLNLKEKPLNLKMRRQ